MIELCLNLRESDAILPIQVPIRDLVIAGWTGRDGAALDAHINELAGIGVAPPKRTPMFYRVSASLLTLANCVQVLGPDSSGEVEFVLIQDFERLLVSVGSDHTDRKTEASSVAMSKQMCPKALASEVWDFTTIEPHWDELILRSYIIAEGDRVPYQEGSVAAILPPRILIESYAAAAAREFSPGAVMFCGTLPVTGGVRPSARFEMELEDPFLKRTIIHSYSTHELPIES